MNVQRALSGLILCSMCIAGVAPPAVAQAAAPKAPVRLSGTVRVTSVSSPASGVKLLEEVFQRVRSAPQVAMAKNLKLAQEEAQQTHILSKQGPTDYSLAIRPKQSGKVAMLPSPTLQLVPSASESKPVLVATGPATASGAYINAAKPDVFDGLGSMGGAPTNALNGEPPPPPANVAEQWMGARQFPVVAAAPAQANSGIWESNVSDGTRLAGHYSRLQDKKMSAAGAPAAAQNAPLGGGAKVLPLGTAVGRLMGAMKTVQDAENARAIAVAPQVAAKKAEQTGFVYGDEGISDNFGLGLPPVNMAAHVKEKPAAKTPSRAKRSSDKVAVSSARRDKDLDAIDDRGVVANKLENWRERRLAMNSGADIALLPPNVVTGIPLIHLGIPENQASTALSSVGTMHHDKVSSWSVWSWQKQPSSSQTALQLYMRGGLLDAMRIFDRTLITRDFGVTLGDDLAKVKEKFGEPAFILQEPGGSGQNYIYPISQVGFQLTRAANDQPPRVVSVLIFNVK